MLVSPDTSGHDEDLRLSEAIDACRQLNFRPSRLVEHRFADAARREAQASGTHLSRIDATASGFELDLLDRLDLPSRRSPQVDEQATQQLPNWPTRPPAGVSQSTGRVGAGAHLGHLPQPPPNLGRLAPARAEGENEEQARAAAFVAVLPFPHPRRPTAHPYGANGWRGSFDSHASPPQNWAMSSSDRSFTIVNVGMDELGNGDDPRDTTSHRWS